jgi:hypothetical protein
MATEQPQVFVQHKYQYTPLSNDDTVLFEKVDER